MKLSLPSSLKTTPCRLRLCGIASAALVLGFSPLQAGEPPADGAHVEKVKSYLLTTEVGIEAASKDFVKKSAEYQKIIEAHKGDYAAALKADRAKILSLVEDMRKDYMKADSFGYERIEGIIAGVDSLADFDVYLDSGVPKAKATKDLAPAPTTFTTKSGKVIKGEGCIFTFLIEPTLWGKNKDHIVAVEVGGDGSQAAKDSLPEAEFIAAAGVDMDKKIEEMIAASKAWKPTEADCFGAVIKMTPTLSGYFDDWKDSRYEKESSGLFSAVSRVSDMQGIMESVAITYDAVDPAVAKKDPALSKTIKGGFTDIDSFVKHVGEREKKEKGNLTVAEIEELHNQAQAKADKLVPQVEQAAAVVGVKVSAN